MCVQPRQHRVTRDFGRSGGHITTCTHVVSYYILIAQYDIISIEARIPSSLSSVFKRSDTVTDWYYKRSVRCERYISVSDIDTRAQLLSSRAANIRVTAERVSVSETTIFVQASDRRESFSSQIQALERLSDFPTNFQAADGAYGNRKTTIFLYNRGDICQH